MIMLILLATTLHLISAYVGSFRTLTLKLTPFKLFSSNRPYLHLTEYPNDNYNHIYGFGNVDHTPSILQSISEEVIRDVKIKKVSYDSVSPVLFEVLD